MASTAITPALRAMAGALMLILIRTGLAADTSRVDPDGTIHVPAFVLPESSFLDEYTLAILKRSRISAAEFVDSCPPMNRANRQQMPSIRYCEAEQFYRTPRYKSVLDHHAVHVTREAVGGVPMEVFIPKANVRLRGWVVTTNV